MGKNCGFLDFVGKESKISIVHTIFRTSTGDKLSNDTKFVYVKLSFDP